MKPPGRGRNQSGIGRYMLQRGRSEATRLGGACEREREREAPNPRGSTHTDLERADEESGLGFLI